MSGPIDEETLRLAVRCLDLTNLDEDCAEADVTALAARATTPAGTVAALCVWPRFVTAARAAAPPDVRIATVVAFPTGEESDEESIDLAREAVRDGADEIDVVIPWRAMKEGLTEAVTSRVQRVRRAGAGAPVKAILETGVLDGPEEVRRAAELAIAGGADFVKTSTGKTPVGATLAAADAMLEAIAAAERPVGFKASGGIRTASEAAAYLDLARDRMGADWVTPARFRFGASSLLDALLSALAGEDAGTPEEEGY